MTKKQLLKDLISKIELPDKLFNCGLDNFQPLDTFIKTRVDRLLFPNCSNAYRHSLKVCLEQLNVTTLERLKEQLLFSQLTDKQQINDILDME